MSSPSTLVVARRFCGPPSSGNGGWTAGAVARLLDAAGDGTGVTGTVRLHRPPPLDTDLRVTRTDDAVEVGDDGGLVARATVTEATDADLAPAPPIDATTARAAEADYPGHRHHPFPTCFTCGPAREPGDGLRIFSGPAGEDLSAAVWTPPSDVDAPVVWAALDCPSAWASGVDERPMVLGTMTARLYRLPAPGIPHVVVGEHRGTQGRKVRAAATLRDPDGVIVGTAEHVWIIIDPEDFL